MTNLQNYKSQAPAVIGSTTINHAARLRLGLNCSEYVLLDHMSRKEDKGSQADTLTVFIQTGFTNEETARLFKSLVGKGFVRLKSNSDFELTTKWEEAFPDMDKEFDAYMWYDNGKVAWTGTKKKAMEYYVKLRKKYSREFLFNQRNNYFEFLRLQKKLRNFDQQRLMCQVFLNPANERFNEDYADYIVQIKARYGDPDEVKPKAITKEEILKQYGKDNNK